MKLTLRLIGMLGILLFGTAFWFTYVVPGGVENVAADFVKLRIEKEVGEKIESLSSAVQDTKIGRIAQRIMKGHEMDMALLQKQLRAKAYEKTAMVIAEMRDLSCECRQTYAQHFKQVLEVQLLSLQASNEALMDFMKSKYMEVVNKLTLDLRIFTGINLAIFLALLLSSFIKPQAVVHLFLPGVLLAISTLACSYFYLFGQNWFFTIIYNDYVGFGYVGYILALFAILCDILFNKARITTEILNNFFDFIGSALSVSPC